MFGIQDKQYAPIRAASINQKASSVQCLSSHISLIFSILFGNNEGHRDQTQCGCHFLQRPSGAASRSGVTVCAVLSKIARPLFPTAADFGPARFKQKSKNVLDQYPYSQVVLSLPSAPTSTTASAKTSSHMTRCKEEERSYCVNGGECLTVNVTPNSTKHLCR